MSLTSKVVNIYSDYTIQPNTFSIYIIPPVGIPGGFNIFLPKIYNTSLELASFRITNYSTYNITMKYIANADDNTAGTFTTLTILSGGSKSSVTIDNINQTYSISDSSNTIDNSATYLPLTGGTIVGNLSVNSGTKSFIIDTNGSKFNGKVGINAPGGAAPYATSDLDVYQSNNSDMSALTTPKTNGLRLYANGATSSSGIFYQLGVDSNGYLSLFKTDTGVTTLTCTFTPNGITGINQQLPATTVSNGGSVAGQLAGKGYVDNSILGRFDTLIGSEAQSTNTGRHSITLTQSTGNLFMIRFILYTSNFGSFQTATRIFSVNSGSSTIVGYAFESFMTAWNSNECSIQIYTIAPSNSIEFQWYFNGAISGYGMYVYV